MPKFPVPNRMAFESGTAAAAQSLTLSTSTPYTSVVWVQEETISLKKVGFYASTAGSNTSPANAVVNVTVETVDALGIPTGTAVCSGSATLPLTVGWNEVTFTTAGTLNAGTVYALKMQASSTPTAAPVIVYGYTNMTESFMPYFVTTGTRSANRVMEIFYLVDNEGGGKYYGYPMAAPNLTNLNSGTPEAGIKFKIPTTVCNTYKVSGIRFTGDPNDLASINVKLSIYDWNNGANSTALDSTEFSSYVHSTAADYSTFEYYFDSPPTLTTGNNYIVAVGTTDATSASIPMRLRYFIIPDATKPALFDHTTDYVWDYVSRTSTTGSWSVTADQSFEMQLIISVVTPLSSGSTAANPLVGYVR